jgi:hypothetical protein
MSDFPRHAELTHLPLPRVSHSLKMNPSELLFAEFQIAEVPDPPCGGYRTVSFSFLITKVNYQK